MLANDPQLIARVRQECEKRFPKLSSKAQGEIVEFASEMVAQFSKPIRWPEYKALLVELVAKEGYSEIARASGLGKTTLYRWRREVSESAPGGRE